MTTKYRLVKETFPDRVRYSTEKLIPNMTNWCFVCDSLAFDEETARKLFDKIVERGFVPTIEVLAKASVERAVTDSVE